MPDYSNMDIADLAKSINISKFVVKQRREYELKPKQFQPEDMCPDCKERPRERSAKDGRRRKRCAICRLKKYADNKREKAWAQGRRPMAVWLAELAERRKTHPEHQPRRCHLFLPASKVGDSPKGASENASQEG